MKGRLLIRGIIFDLYGTLIHLEKKFNPYLCLFKHLKIKTSTAAAVALTEDFANFAQLAYRLAPDHEMGEFSLYEQELQQEIATAALYPETLEVLKKICHRKLRTAVISNLASPYRQPYFDLGLDELIDFRAFSCELGFKKPDKRIYQLVIEEWNCSPGDILMVGDSLSCDVRGAKTAGMKAVLLDRQCRSSGRPERICSLSNLFEIL